MTFRTVDHQSYKTIGCCIYCGTAGEGLSREHVIPFSLGGNVILRKASCRKCSSITRDFEQTVTRTLFGDMRMQLGFPSRRSKERPNTIDFIIGKNGNKTKKAVLRDQLPCPPIPIPVLAAPGILSLKPPTDEVTVKINLYQMGIDDPATWDKYRQIHPSDPGAIGYQITIQYLAFARMIAKIVHGLAVAEFGLGTFQSLLIPYILGTDTKISYVVGGAHEMDRPEAPDEIGWAASFGVFNRGDTRFYTCKLELFRFLNPRPTPYWVVIAKADDRLADLILHKGDVVST
jgi:hypothetical protein